MTKPLVRECPNTPWPDNSMRKRQHPIQIYLNDEELKNLDEWSAACRMTRSDYIRNLIQGFQPVAFPPLEYSEVLFELRRIGVNMNQIATKAHTLGFIDVPDYEQNAKRVWSAVAEFSKQLRNGGVKFGSNKDMGGKQ